MGLDMGGVRCGCAWSDGAKRMGVVIPVLYGMVPTIIVLRSMYVSLSTSLGGYVGGASRSV